MEPINTARSLADLAPGGPAPGPDPLTAVAMQRPHNADVPRASIKYWYLFGDGAIGTGINTNAPTKVIQMNKMLRFLLAFALSTPVFAETTVIPATWELRRGTTLLQTGISSEQACGDNATARNVTATYTCRTNTKVVVSAVVAPPTTCGAQPVGQVRTAACPVGTTGSWVQTNAYVAAASPTCWTPSSWLPTAAPAGTCVPTTPPGAVNFTTNFDTVEIPISENGAWTKTPNPWLPVRTEAGVAHASGVNAGYDDSYAYLTQPFGPDQIVEAVLEVSSAPFDRSKSHESLIMLRMSDDASNARGYECLFNYWGGWDLVRWTGPIGGFQSLHLTYTGFFERDLVTGDVVKCSVIGNTITGYINNVMMIQATDSSITSGQPGIAFFVRPGGDLRHLNFTRITATSN